MATVSIVTPSYNHAHFLPERVSSILNQTYTDFEWTIIDDCSTDGSRDLLWELVDNDPRVTLIYHSKNVGMAATTREAIEACSGRYIYRAESDDVCHPRFLECMVEALESHPQVGLAYCRALSMDEAGNLWGGWRQAKQDTLWKGSDLFRKLVIDNFIPGGNMLFSRTAHDAVGGFGVEPFQIACDYHFNLRMCLKYDIAYVSEPLAYHRIHCRNLSRAVRRTYDLDTFFRESYGVLIDVFEAIPVEQAQLRDLKDAAIRRMTLRRAVPLYINAVQDRKWQVARAIREGVERYDLGATQRYDWVWNCICSLLNRNLYRIYQSLGQRFTQQRAANHGIT